MQHRFVSLEVWPYPPTRQRRGRYAFKAPWSNTLRLLDSELRHLGAQDCTIAAGFREQDLRLDGLPRAGAREPSHPGVILSFTARKIEGWPQLNYGTDTCERWEHNVRSIALGLESLRAVDRYGITRRAEQYAGFRLLTTGADQPSIARGRKLIAEASGDVRGALRRTHPDNGGDSIDFQSVRMAQHAIEDVGA